VRVAPYDDPASLQAALAGVDRLLLISSSEVGRSVQQHQNVIEAAKAAGVQFIAYTSAPLAATTSLILAPDHKATEELLFSSGMDFTILRNNWYTENYLQQLNTARQTGKVVTAAGLLAEVTHDLSHLIRRPTTPLVEGVARRVITTKEFVHARQQTAEPRTSHCPSHW
jgi:uncharacterized protein YbjT (DUF2867 family)